MITTLGSDGSSRSTGTSKQVSNACLLHALALTRHSVPYLVCLSNATGETPAPDRAVEGAARRREEVRTTGRWGWVGARSSRWGPGW